MFIDVRLGLSGEFVSIYLTFPADFSLMTSLSAYQEVPGSNPDSAVEYFCLYTIQDVPGSNLGFFPIRKFNVSGRFLVGNIVVYSPRGSELHSRLCYGVFLF